MRAPLKLLYCFIVIAFLVENLLQVQALLMYLKRTRKQTGHFTLNLIKTKTHASSHKNLFLFSQKTALLKEISAQIQPNKQQEKKQTLKNHTVRNDDKDNNINNFF